jgi:hypothetical protein
MWLSGTCSTHSPSLISLFQRRVKDGSIRWDRKSNSPSCRKKRDKDGATAGVSRKPIAGPARNLLFACDKRNFPLAETLRRQFCPLP